MKKVLEIIKELRKTPRGKAVLFFGFYFIFFFVLILMIRTSPKNPSMPIEEEKETFPIANYLTKKYQFIYTIQENQKEEVYQGKKFENRSLFQKNGVEYFEEDGEFYQKQSSWEKSENPYWYSEFMKEENIISLISHSMPESTTTYESGSVMYQFVISTNTINELLYQKETDIEEVPNRISVRMDEKEKLSSIVYYLDSYCAAVDSCDTSLKIHLSYQNMGEIDSVGKPF